MSEEFVMGIDCGGTHTDAAVLAVDGQRGQARLLASAKTATRHEDLPASVRKVVDLVGKELADPSVLRQVARITLGTTLEVNALVQNRADRVGLALSAGPGLDPIHFGLGENVCVVPGGLDHRGMEVSQLFTDELAQTARAWPAEGVAAVACVGKFSPRNPAHEEEMGRIAAAASGLPVTLGHNLSGRLNFPRRIATAYYNAAVARIHHNFLDAVEKSFHDLGLRAQCRLLKADGGAIPFALSRREPVQSILSGPAASVMGALALWKNAARGCSLLLDMGGTTTDLALFLSGSPVVDRNGMVLAGRRTLVRSLASISIGVGGDSRINVQKKPDGTLDVSSGPMRDGPAMAFGGTLPTLLDALNTLDGENSAIDRGDIHKSREGLALLAEKHGLSASGATNLAKMAVANALDKIANAAYDLVEGVNSRPIYTLAGLKSARQARPSRVCLVGGPSKCLKARLSEALGLPVDIAPHPQVANAIGAALAIPTASLEIWVDTGKGELSAPALDYVERIAKNYTLDQAKERACELLRERLEREHIQDGRVEVVEADLFATLDDRGRGARDMRVACQARPGIMAQARDGN